VPNDQGGVENLQPLGLAASAAHLTLAAPGSKRQTTVALFDQGLTQVVQAAVAGVEPGTRYMLALTSNRDGSGSIEPLAEFTSNPAGAQIVNAVGPIRQIVDPAAGQDVRRRYLTVLTLVEGGKPGRAVQVQQFGADDAPVGRR
jgi:hypothetical protein